MKKTAALWRYFLEKVTAALTSVGAVSAPEHWTRHRWLLQTVYGSYELTVHNPELSDIYTFSVFGRFLSDGPFPAAANQLSGQLNFHLLGPETKITRADIDDFVSRLKGRLEAMRPLARENPRQDFGALERAWEGAQLRRHYASQEDGPEPKERLKLEIYQGDDIVVDTFDVERRGRGFTVTDEYLNDPDQTVDWREVDRLLAEHDPKPVKGKLVIELPARNPAERLRIGDVVMGVQGVDGGYVGVVESLSADHSGKPIVSFRGEDGVLRETYLFNVTKNVPSSGKFPRKNPAVTGERGQYRLHYMEPGARKGTFRQAIRRVNSVPEAERWMNDNAGRAFLPASVMTPGNRWQSPDVVAILGPDRRPASAQTSYARRPV